MFRQKAIVTGAIGLQVVRQLADLGVNVVLTARTQQALEHGLAGLNGALFGAIDRVDILIDNAGRR